MSLELKQNASLDYTLAKVLNPTKPETYLGITELIEISAFRG